jgi:hypothetical protein
LQRGIEGDLSAVVNPSNWSGAFGKNWIYLGAFFTGKEHIDKYQ